MKKKPVATNNCPNPTRPQILALSALLLVLSDDAVVMENERSHLALSSL
jgi:hypothetical protein